MSLLGLWDQILGSSSAGNLGGARPARKFVYVPQDHDTDSDSDAEDDCQMASQYDDLPKAELEKKAESSSNAHCKLCGAEYGDRASFCGRCGMKCDQLYIISSSLEKEAALRAVSEVQRIVSSFCGQVCLTRVTPTESEMEVLWMSCAAFTPTLSDRGQAELEMTIVSTLAGQLSGELDAHDWKPQLRALCVLQFLYCKGGLQRRIAEEVIEESAEILQHLATEVVPCKEQALRVMQLSKLAEVVAPDQGLAVDRDGGVYVLKAAAGTEVPELEDDRDTMEGSSFAAEASDSQDEQFEASRPSSLQEDSSAEFQSHQSKDLPKEVISDSMHSILDLEIRDATSSPEVDGDSLGESQKIQKPVRRVIPVIPWGIEDTIPKPEDPFASLVTV